MNESRRQLLKVLPVAALSGAMMKIDGIKAEAIELKPSKRYVFKINADVDQKDLDTIRQKLIERGFPEYLVISGDVDIFELDKL